jgi:hypothetical protein
MAYPNVSISYPFGDVDVQALTATGTQNLTIQEMVTLIDGATVKATGNRTIVLTISSSVKAGARILFVNKTNTTETTTFSTGFLCPTLTGVTGKNFSAEFFYDGTVFKPAAAPYQID